MSETAARLWVEGLVVTRGGRAVVRKVSLDLRAGQIAAMLGPSGAGKSTFFAAVAGEIGSAQGRVLIDGINVTGLPLWRRVRLGLGYVPQGPSVLFDLTVAENLTTFARLSQSSVDSTAQAISLGLGERLGVRAGELSGGERRRLELARALLLQPKVLLCDEPFAGVDPAGVILLADALRAQADAGCAILLSDHHAAEALRVADVAHLLIDGALEATSAPGAFLAQPVVTARYVGR